MLFFNHEILTKSPHIESNSNTADSGLDGDHRSKCFFTLSQVKLKDYHDTKQYESPRNFKVSDAVFCANIKPNKLDLKFSLAKHVIIETKARDKFRLVNVDTVNHVGSQCKVFKACA